MAVRQTGFALLASASVQEAHDFACIAHAATLPARTLAHTAKRGPRNAPLPPPQSSAPG